MKKPGSAVSRGTFRNVMASVCAPVTVVTTLTAGRPYGSTVSAFASLSLEPPMVSVALDRRSNLLAAIQTSGTFGVNVLHRDHQAIATRFAQSDVDRFAGVEWAIANDVPRLTGAGGWIACEVASAVEGGDHVLLLGAVVDAIDTDLEPLTYAHRTFGTHATLPPLATVEPNRGTHR